MIYCVYVSSDGTFIGYCPVEDESEIEAPESMYILFDELPTELETLSPDKFAVIDRDTKAITIFDREIPPQPKTPEQERIEQLEAENALIALELAETQMRLDQSEQEQAHLLFELVSKGVI